MNATVSAMMVAFACGSALAAEPVQVLFPYSIAGRVVNYDGIAYEASDDITLYVRNPNGAVLAKSKVFDPGSVSAWNYRLDVPVATRSGGGYAAAGEVLSLSAVDAKGVVYEGLIQGDDAVVGQGGGTATVRVMLADDANGNGIADIYEQSKEYDMWLADISDPVFDPDKDYDGDGVSNYAEYLAGTDPFDREDYFRVKQVSGLSAAEADAEDVIALTFEANAGRSYVVNETPTLASGATRWTRGVFRLDPAKSATVERVTNDKNTWSERTIYLIKSGASRFYKVEMEQ
ncbi:MAG: thrombospondin type 3 repeat-containing protein [Kiritimatiellia bacterium]